MKIRDIFAKIDSFGLFMEQWGVLQESNEWGQADKWHQSAAITRDELISDIKDVADRASKSDKAYNIYKMYDAGQITPDTAIEAIGRIYE